MKNVHYINQDGKLDTILVEDGMKSFRIQEEDKYWGDGRLITVELNIYEFKNIDQKKQWFIAGTRPSEAEFIFRNHLEEPINLTKEKVTTFLNHILSKQTPAIEYPAFIFVKDMVRECYKFGFNVEPNGRDIQS